MRQTLLVLLVVCSAAIPAPGFASGASRNWSYWRGPEQNGVSRERDLPAKFSMISKSKDSNLIFAVPYGSITTPIVQDNQVYLINKVGEGETLQERVMAFNADTGAVAWEHKFNVWDTDIVEARLGFTHLVGDPETGNVYAHTSAGYFVCFDKKGKIVWQHSMTEEYGRVTGYGGRVNSAIIDEDMVILSLINSSWGEYTIGNTRMVAFDKKKGHVIWWGSGGYRVKDTYSASPVVAVINGQRLILTGGGDGCIHAFQVRTGVKAWSYKLEDGGGAINCSPVVKGNLVWIGHGEENHDNGTQGRIVCLDAGAVTKGAPKLVWKYDGIKAKFAAPILDNDLLYLCDAACGLYCFDAVKGGEPIWKFKYGKNTKGSPVLADGKIYVSDADSRFVILKPTKEACKYLHQQRFRGTGVAPVELHGSPAVVNGRVYFTTTQQLICIGKPDHKAEPDPMPPAVKEPATDKKADVAHLQVIPADVGVEPGKMVNFIVYAYDANGRYLYSPQAQWSRQGMLPPVFPIGLTAPKPAPGAKPPPALAGTLSEESGKKTTFTAAKIPNGQFGRVVAKVGNFTTGYARVRVVPGIPQNVDFKKVPLGRTPGGWVNAMAKFAVVKLPDGTQVLRKRTDNASPLVASASAYIGSPTASDYSVEADVQGSKVRNTDMSDIGVGACHYTLLLNGNAQELRLGTWDVQERLEKKVAFPWKPGVWYRMKITAAVQGGKGIVKGKVWPRGEKEPEAWTLEITDPIPQAEGSPVIFGSATGTKSPMEQGAEIFYDNIKVTPNKK